MQRFCLECTGDLVLRQGTVNVFHFAHRLLMKSKQPRAIQKNMFQFLQTQVSTPNS